MRNAILYGLCFLVGLLAACSGGASSDPTKPHIQWTYRISPANAGRPRGYTTPAVAPDGTIYAGGAAEDGSATAYLYAVHPDGTLQRTLTGTRGDFRGAPRVWPKVRPDGKVTYAVDEDGGLYAMRESGEDVFRQTPEEAFSKIREKTKPRLLGPIIAGERGDVYAGGTRFLHVLYIESRSTPLSLSVECGDEVRPGAYPNGDVYCHGKRISPYDELGKKIGRALPSASGDPSIFDPRGGLYYADRRGLRIEGPRAWRYDLDEYVTSAPRVGHDGTVYFTTARTLTALNRDATKKWDFQTEHGFHTEPVLTQEGLFVTDTGGNLLALSLDGQEKWRIELGEYCSSPAIGGDGTLYTICQDGLLYAVTPPSQN